MNIDDRLREIIRDELRPILNRLDAILRADEPRISSGEPVAADDSDGARWLTGAEAARRLRLSPSTLANWRAAGTGPAFCRIGRAVRYDAAEIEQFVTTS